MQHIAYGCSHSCNLLYMSTQYRTHTCVRVYVYICIYIYIHTYIIHNRSFHLFPPRQEGIAQSKEKTKFVPPAKLEWLAAGFSPGLSHWVLKLCEGPRVRVRTCRQHNPLCSVLYPRGQHAKGLVAKRFQWLRRWQNHTPQQAAASGRHRTARLERV